VPQSLTNTRADAGQALALNGRALIAVHEQIVGVLRQRLGANHGQLFAAARVQPDGSVAWTTPSMAEPVIGAAQLSADEREKLQARSERMVSEIQGLAEQLRGEGPAAQVVAQMLDGAVRQPPGEWLYSVGGKPVLVMWGHAVAGSAAALAPLAPSTPSTPLALGNQAAAAAPPPLGAPSLAAAAPSGKAPPPISAPGATAAAGPSTATAAATATVTDNATDTDTAADHAAARRWLPWALLGALAVIILLWGLKSCSDLVPADPALAEKLTEAEVRNQALEGEIARQRSATPAQQCVPDAAPVARAPEPPAAAPEPSVSAAAPPPELQPAAPPRPAASAAPARPKPPPATPPPAPPFAATKPEKPPAAEPESPRAAAPSAAPRQACKPHSPGDEPEVVMVIDGSGSMRKPMGATTRLEAAKRAAESMIRSLPADVEVGLVDFSACSQVRRDKFYPAAQRGALVGEIDALAPKRGTPLADAIRRAGAVASDSAPSVIVVVSDGGDSCGGDPCAAAASVRASKPNVTINVIDLSESPTERQVLQCVARAGGGRVLSPGDPIDMNRKMKEAAAVASCP